MDWSDPSEVRSARALGVGEVITLDELLKSPDRGSHATEPETDALANLDALQEADLVDVRFDALSASLVLLLDLRTSLQYHLANTAVLALRGLAELHWTSHDGRGSRRMAHNVMSSKPGVEYGRVTLEVVCLNGWRLWATASAGEFYVGDIPGLSEAQPNFVTDDEKTILAGMPDWESPFIPKSATFLSPNAS
jgi:hypothetical protein